MKIGRISPIPTDPKDPWCPYDNLEKDDIFPVLDYLGSCINCGTGEYAREIMAVYCFQKDGHHVFQPIEEMRCKKCGLEITGYIVIMCMKTLSDVTDEFKKLKK